MGIFWKLTKKCSTVLMKIPIRACCSCSLLSVVGFISSGIKNEIVFQCGLLDPTGTPIEREEIIFSLRGRLPATTEFYYNQKTLA